MPSPIPPDAVNAILGLDVSPRTALVAALEAMAAAEIARVEAFVAAAPDDADRIRTAELLLDLLYQAVRARLEAASLRGDA